MSNTRYTKGSWIKDGLAIDSKRFEICVVSQDKDEDGNKMSREEAEANAKLIAAAPTMYETLDECSNRIAYCIDLYELPEEAVAMLRGEIDAMLATMKKATE